MILMGFRHKSMIISVILTCNLILICVLFSSNVDFSFSAADVEQAEKEVELETNIITVNGTEAPVKTKDVAPLKPHKYLKFVEISKAFRKTIQQESGYWNRKQHLLFKRLDSAVKPEGNASQWKQPDGTPCNRTSPEVFRVNIHDFNSYSSQLQEFLHTMHCRDPAILIDQPNKCPWVKGESRPFVLFAVKSSPRNFEQRQAVRETWGREATLEGGLELRTVFLLGTSSSETPDLQDLVTFEALHYRDILQWDFSDTFFNLTLKDNAFLGWVQQRCPGVSFVFKGDDDVFVNRLAMVDFLRSLEPGKAARLYTGQIVTKASPIREGKSKYYIPQTFYDGPYPSYAGGGGYLFSGSLVSPLFQVSQHIGHYPIDDVYTGMCFQALGIDPIPHSGFRTFDISADNRENICAHKDLLLVHQRTPQEILRLWRHLLSPLLDC